MTSGKKKTITSINKDIYLEKNNSIKTFRKTKYSRSK